MIVIVANENSLSNIPDGSSNDATKVSFPSRAMLSSLIVNSTQASVSPAANDATSVSLTKSVLEAINWRKKEPMIYKSKYL